MFYNIILCMYIASSSVLAHVIYNDMSLEDLAVRHNPRRIPNVPVPTVLPRRNYIQDRESLVARLFTTARPGTSVINGVVVQSGTPSRNYLYRTANVPENKPEEESIVLSLADNQSCHDGVCVPYYLCKNNSLISDGDGIIWPRTNLQNPSGCHYLETCCARKDIQTVPTISPNPVPVKGCGHRQVNGVGFKIRNNNIDSQFGEFPWMTAILFEELISEQKINVYKCGGALIHPQVILTAAHCVSGKTCDSLKVRVGDWDSQTNSEIFPHQERYVSQVVIHDEFTMGNLFNDIALLFLNDAFNLAENVQTMCLPPPNVIFDRSQCVASGWGKDMFGRDGVYQLILKKIDLPIVPRQSCVESLRTTALGAYFQLHESFICAGGEQGKDTCNGDGGSPLICPIAGTSDRYYQAGIVAWGMGCGDKQIPGVYVNVAHFRNWIDDKLQEKGLDSSSYTA